MYIYTYIYIYIHIHTHMHIFIYIFRDKINKYTLLFVHDTKIFFCKNFKMQNHRV